MVELKERKKKRERKREKEKERKKEREKKREREKERERERERERFIVALVNEKIRPDTRPPKLNAGVTNRLTDLMTNRPTIRLVRIIKSV